MPLFDFIQTALEDEFSLVNHEYVIRHLLDFVQQMRRKDFGTSIVGHGANDRVQNVSTHDGIEPRRGFVQQKKLRTMSHCRNQAGLCSHSFGQVFDLLGFVEPKGFQQFIGV
jgi:hypothetical protein